jgi:hypothetical protein
VIAVLADRLGVECTPNDRQPSEKLQEDAGYLQLRLPREVMRAVGMEAVDRGTNSAQAIREILSEHCGLAMPGTVAA